MSIINHTLADQLNTLGNLQYYPNPPKLSDAQTMALAISSIWWSAWRGVYHSMDMSKASVHDVHYLEDISHSGLSHCLLLADKGYLSARQQIDLFEHARIELQTPMRSNQPGFRPGPAAYKQSRRRVETIFSQLYDQMMLKRNYAKTFTGVRARICSKIAAFYHSTIHKL